MNKVRQQRVTQSEVDAVADEISAAGGSPGTIEVHTRLGRGSNSTIGKMLEVWRSKRTAAALPPVAATLPPDITNAVAVHIAREIAANKKVMDQAVAVETAARQAAESQLDQLKARVEVLAADREQLREERDQFAGRLKQVQEDIGSERNRLIGEAKAAEDRAHAAALQVAALDATLRSVTERMEAAEARERARLKPRRS